MNTAIDDTELAVPLSKAAMLDVLVNRDIGDAWRVSLLTNIYFAPIIREFENVYDISQPEFVILYCCHLLPGIMAKDICDLTGRPQNSISRGSTRLVKKKMIKQQSDRIDRRRKFLYLTAEGQRALEPLLNIHKVRQRELFSALNAEELRSLRIIFDKLIISSFNTG